MVNRFDEAAQNWDSKPGRMEMASKFAHEIITDIEGEKYSSALEYGCGTANVSFVLRDYFQAITLSDNSPGMIDEVKRKISENNIKHFHPLLANVEEKPIKGKFDVIYTNMTLHHIQNIEKVIKELSLLLNPDGMLMIGDLESEDGNFHTFPENQEVHNGFDKIELEKILNNCGLKLYKYHIFHEMERDHTGKVKTYGLFYLMARPIIE